MIIEDSMQIQYVNLTIIFNELCEAKLENKNIFGEHEAQSSKEKSFKFIKDKSFED